MAISLIALAVLVFVGLCWLIGARSRLLRLHETVLALSRQLGEALQQQAEWVSAQSMLSARTGDADWQRANAAAAQLVAALSLPSGGAGLPKWDVVSTAHGVQSNALHMIYQLHRVYPENSDISGDQEVIPKEEVDLHLHANRVKAAAQAYSEGRSRYNQAIAMFPAQALAWLLRLRVAEPFSESIAQP